MNLEMLLKVLLKSEVIKENPRPEGAPVTYDIDLTHFNEYGKFVIKSATEEAEKCPHCGKFDHEDGGCTLLYK